VILGLLWVGRTKDVHLDAIIQDYLGRIERYMPVKVTAIKEQTAADRHAESEARNKEGRRLIEALPAGHRVVALDQNGRQATSEQFARLLGEQLNGSLKGMTFVIGGHLGLAPEVLERADQTLSLSRMTLTHEMARLVAVEQIYRGLNILRGGRYHRP
jgi:23S rRNA (pseudouridine1915-N3)-methyltransferase